MGVPRGGGRRDWLQQREPGLLSGEARKLPRDAADRRYGLPGAGIGVPVRVRRRSFLRVQRSRLLRSCVRLDRTTRDRRTGLPDHASFHLPCLVRRSHVRRPGRLCIGGHRPHLPLPGGDLRVRVGWHPRLYRARARGMSRQAAAGWDCLCRPLHDLGNGHLRRPEHEVPLWDLAARPMLRLKLGRGGFLAS